MAFYLIFPVGALQASTKFTAYKAGGVEIPISAALSPVSSYLNGKVFKRPIVRVQGGLEGIAYINTVTPGPVWVFQSRGTGQYSNNVIDDTKMSTAALEPADDNYTNDSWLGTPMPMYTGTPVEPPVTEPSQPQEPEPMEPQEAKKNIIQLKRRANGDSGAPLAARSGEVAFNEVSQVLYYGFGDDGNGNAVSIQPIAGTGAYLDINSEQTVVGIKTFSGEIHVQLPTLPSHAANREYVDEYVTQKVAEAVATAFSYKGEVSALSVPPANPAVGYLYRVKDQGNFGGSTAFIVSAGDFIVWNGTGWDKIDNTDPVISNTDGKIIVERTGDNSYSVNLAEDYSGSTQITQLGTVTEGVWEGAIIALTHGGTGADLSTAPDGTLFKKVGTMFVPAIAGQDYVKTNIGVIDGGTF